MNFLQHSFGRKLHLSVAMSKECKKQRYHESSVAMPAKGTAKKKLKQRELLETCARSSDTSFVLDDSLMNYILQNFSRIKGDILRSYCGD